MTDHKINEGDCVWRNDLAYQVIAVLPDERLHIRIIDFNTYVPGADDDEVHISEVELFTEDDYDLLN